MAQFKMKRTKFALTALQTIYGVNKVTATKLVGCFALHPRGHDSNLLISKYREAVFFTLSQLRIGFRLRLIVFSRILNQMFLKNYRAIRRRQGLPGRGGRTHANGGTPYRLRVSGKFLPFDCTRRYFTSNKRISKKEKARLKRAKLSSLKGKKKQDNKKTLKSKPNKPNKRKNKN